MLQRTGPSIVIGTASPSQYPTSCSVPQTPTYGLFPVPMLSDALLYAALLPQPEASGFLSDRRELK